LFFFKKTSGILAGMLFKATNQRNALIPHLCSLPHLCIQNPTSLRAIDGQMKDLTGFLQAERKANTRQSHK
jgi:hypothetical protein